MPKKKITLHQSKPSRSTPKPPGHWDHFTNLERELRAFIAKYGETGVMPAKRTLQAKGLNGLVSAISKHGGIFVVAERLGLKCSESHKPSGYWHDFENIRKELLEFVAKHGTNGMMPIDAEFKKANQGHLANAIRRHGGFAAVAEKVGLEFSPERKPLEYWNDFENIKSEIEAFIVEHGTPGVMPTVLELNEAERTNLDNAIGKHGGFAVVAERLGLQRTQPNKPAGYWKNFTHVEDALRAFISERGTEGVMPTTRELEVAGRANLIVGIGKHGGLAAVAEKLRLKRPEAKKAPGYWEDFANVEKELQAYIVEHGTDGVMPTLREMNAGHSSLAYAINKQGGFVGVADRLGLQRQSSEKPVGFWDDLANVQNEILTFAASLGKEGTMPAALELKAAKRFDLMSAINKHGGFSSVAEKLGLRRVDTSKPYGYWDDFSNVEQELRGFIAEYGQAGVMPMQRELSESGRFDLTNAVSNHGSFSEVARRLGLAYLGKEYITSRTASSVEHTARAIQPLAEANLLSPAQVMVILRRAGLLAFRNSRVVKLNASLARGDHAEIESALANLLSGGEQLATETLTVEETDNMTAEEAEALVSGGLNAGGGAPLKETTAPDTEREATIIRGLSALGELRLPLDEVLGLLTSKVLWQEFYKRLYAWYGSLGTAQTVTVEDVEAAILAAYPDHTANEFVVKASALFAIEVEEAVNFAAALHEHGWYGPRLRLHQADAARRMTDILVRGRSESEAAARLFLLDADDPGMGKSASFLAAVAAAGVHTVVLVAPKTVADDTWCGANGEIKCRLPQTHTVRGLNKTLVDLAALQSKTRAPRTTFYVLHYEEVLNEEAVAALAQHTFDCLCLDEIHFIKLRAGQDLTHRRAALEILRASARAAIGLTGTPLVNELAEPMSLLQTLSGHAPEFDHSRLSNRRLRDIADVFEALLPHVVRRRKREVLLHLPNCDVRPVDIPLADYPDVEEQMLEIYGWPRARASEALVELRKLATDAKLPYLLERAQITGKLLILTYLTDDVSEKIAAYLDDFLPGRVAHVNGQVARAERQKRIDSFRAPDGARVLVGTIGTIGTGLTLFDPKQPDTANQIIMADLPYTWAEFDQGIARLHREGQKQTVRADVLQTSTTATLRNGSAQHTLDERIWSLIEGKRELSDIAIDGKYDATDAAAKVQKALRRWLAQAREIGMEPLAVERRTAEGSEAQRWRGEIGRLRGMSAAKADEVFADLEYTRQFFAHLETSIAAKLSHQWLRGKLTPLLRPDLDVLDMGCGLNPFAALPCRIIGLDRHDRPGQLRGKMETPPLPDKSADVLIYSLSLYGTAADLKSYFTHAARILRGGGHLFIVEPGSAFTPEGLAKFVEGLRQFGFELVGAVKDLRGQEGTLLKALHLTLIGEMENLEEIRFERK